MEFTSTDYRYPCLVWRLINQVKKNQILSLHFLVLSFDRYSRDDVIGEVNVPIEELDIEEGSVTPLMLMKEVTPRCSKVNNYPAMNQFSDNILVVGGARTWRASCLSLSPTRIRKSHCGGSEGEKSSQDGYYRILRYLVLSCWILNYPHTRPICQNIPSTQCETCKEENTHQEENS